MDKLKKLVLTVSILASFVAFLDGSVVNVALPAIAKSLGGGLTAQQWVVDAYLLSLGSLILIAGSLSDLFGRRRILSIGLIGFGAASILCAVAPSALFLVVCRALQGIAGALLVPSSLAIIISTFEGKEQAKAIGSWTAWTGIAFIVGPLVGGLLVDYVSWRAIFAINIIPIAITLWLMRGMEIAEHVKQNARVDLAGAVLCALGLGSTVYALTEQPRYGWGSAMIYTPLLIGILLLVIFVVYQRRAPNPMLQLNLFKIRNFTFGNLATLCIYAGLSVLTFLMIISVQQIGRYSALGAGLSFLPVTILMFFLSPRFGALSGKYGPRFFMSAGPLVSAAGFLLMLQTNSSMHYVTQLLPGVLVFGLGLSMTVAPLTSAVLGDIPHEHAGVGSAINNAVARIAGLIAVAAIGLVVGTNLDIDGLHKGLSVMALLMLTGGLISFVGIRNHLPVES